MTADEWDESNDPEAMLDAVAGRVPDRQLLLYTVGSCRLVGDRVPNLGVVAEMLEQAARGKLDGRDQRRGILETVTSVLSGDLFSWMGLALTQSEAGCWFLARQAGEILRSARGTDGEPAGTPAEQAALLRELLGNPFDPVIVRAEWRTEPVCRIAATIDDSRDFTLLPVLADALQEAGCTEPRLFDHCRGPILGAGSWLIEELLERKALLSEAA
jgi:hypothetical protein